jgi:hypothetical protein
MPVHRVIGVRRPGLEKAGRPAFIVEIDIAIGLLKPWLLGIGHNDINKDRKPAENDSAGSAIGESCAGKAQDRGHILGIAAVPVKAVRYQAVIGTIRILDAEIEIAIDRETKPGERADQADGEAQSFATLRPISRHHGKEDCQAKTAAEERPERVMLPAFGRGGGPQFDRARKHRYEQQQIENSKRGRSHDEDDAGI